MAVAGVSIAEQPVRQTSSLGLLAILLAASSITACASDAWLDESNPSGNHFFDPRVARKVRSFWYVSASQIDAAVQLLKTQRNYFHFARARCAPH